ncbi:hypothetical protein GGP79_000633 [Salinibacter ruber]|nr:hypothetical protein [Salinibacter ruber]
MNDNTAAVEDLHRDLLMARSNEERFKMGVSMCQTARTIVWSSVPEDLSPAERRVQFFLRVHLVFFTCTFFLPAKSHSPPYPPP